MGEVRCIRFLVSTEDWKEGGLLMTAEMEKHKSDQESIARIAAEVYLLMAAAMGLKF